jgi:hypothetical protein
MQMMIYKKLLFSTASDWGCFSRFLTKLPSRAVVKCGFADWNLFMVHE